MLDITSRVNDGGDVSWRLGVLGDDGRRAGSLRAGVSWVARRAVVAAVQGLENGDVTASLEAHAVAGAMLQPGVDPSWVTPANVEAAIALVRRHRARNAPLFRSGTLEETEQLGDPTRRAGQAPG